jgi:hypothetical protein
MRQLAVALSAEAKKKPLGWGVRGVLEFGGVGGFTSDELGVIVWVVGDVRR